MELLKIAHAVPASEFTKNFGRYKLQAQREAIAVSSHGRVAGYFVSAHEYEELQSGRTPEDAADWFVRLLTTDSAPGNVVVVVWGAKVDMKEGSAREECFPNAVR